MKVPSWVSCETMGTWFAEYTVLENLLLGMVRWVWPCGQSESARWTDLALQGLSAPTRLLKISGMYIFPVLQLSVGLLILMWMASLASLATCLLTWSITLKWEMLAWGWMFDSLWLKFALVTWLYVLSFYFLDICWIANVRLTAIVFRTGPFADYSVWGVNIFCL